MGMLHLDVMTIQLESVKELKDKIDYIIKYYMGCDEDEKIKVKYQRFKS